jgi:ATP-dependent helicase Lhr and Lhr-like helicase
MVKHRRASRTLSTDPMTPHPSFSADLFHPLVARWFARQVGVPTAIQKKVWPMIAGGRHVLVTAPTGSGKTLAAFLWALDRLIRGGWDGGQTRILYVSPLKALNNDIRRNLIRPLEELRQGFTAQGEAFPEIRVATRSGDTTSSERRAMIRRPPEILITTPESLHLLLASHGGRTLLGNLRTVILDEIHAVAGNKRGSLLMAAVDRLVPLCGEFQRIALSATLRPVETVAAFVGGFEATGDPDDPDYIPRVVHCCQAGEAPAADMSIHIPKTLIAADADGNLWDELAGTLRSTIDANRATLIFTNSRRLCEKLTFLINQGRPAPIAYAHHGSLSKALRLEVEQRLKNGALKAIVATSSLELGIDIGDLDQVILIQTPPSVASAL